MEKIQAQIEPEEQTTESLYHATEQQALVSTTVELLEQPWEAPSRLTSRGTQNNNPLRQSGRQSTLGRTKTHNNKAVGTKSREHQHAPQQGRCDNKAARKPLGSTQTHCNKAHGASRGAPKLIVSRLPEQPSGPWEQQRGLQRVRWTGEHQIQYSQAGRTPCREEHLFTDRPRSGPTPMASKRAWGSL